MTTIVYDIKNKKVYSDSRLSYLNYKVQKIYKEGGKIFAGAGSISDMMTFKRQFLNLKRFNKQEYTNGLDGVFDMLVISKDGSYEVYDQFLENLNLIETEYVCLGSGGALALAYIEACKDNKKTVDINKLYKAVSKFDNNTDTNIVSVDIN